MKFLSSQKTFYCLFGLIILTNLIQYFSPQLFGAYIQSVFKNLHMLKGDVFFHLRFQAGEFIYILAALLLLFLFMNLVLSIVRFLKNKAAGLAKSALLLFLNVVCIFYLLLFYNWSILYSYSTRNEDIVSYSDTFSLDKNAELLSVLYSKIKDLDPAPFSNEAFNLILEEEFSQRFSEPLPLLKTQKSIFKSFLSALGINGYYHPFTGESYINPELNPSIQPFIMAHEMTHQLGIASESEANYAAYWLCTTSDNPALQYSAYMNVMMHCLYYIKRNDSADFYRTIDTMTESVRNDVMDIYEYRLQSRSGFSEVSLTIYNWFLKKNNNGVGLKAYGKLRRDVYELEINNRRRLPDFPIYSLKEHP